MDSPILGVPVTTLLSVGMVVCAIHVWLCQIRVLISTSLGHAQCHANMLPCLWLFTVCCADRLFGLLGASPSQGQAPGQDHDSKDAESPQEPQLQSATAQQQAVAVEGQPAEQLGAGRASSSSRNAPEEPALQSSIAQQAAGTQQGVFGAVRPDCSWHHSYCLTLSHLDLSTDQV